MSVPNILVVDDSRMFLRLLVQKVRHHIPSQVFAADSLKKTQTLLDGHDFDMAMLDLNLPDAPQGEVVDLVLKYDVPVIVFASACSERLRKRLWAKDIADYVIKEGDDSLQYAVSQARRILRNRNIKVLVVEDSESVRGMIAKLLRVHRFQVFEADGGASGLRVLQDNPDIRLIIADYEMPEMDGVQFLRKVRQTHAKEQMAVIGVSSHEDEPLSTRFLKSGANDFLTKPFSSEEFYCRISQNIELLEYIEEIKEYSEKDFLTGLYNRRYLFQNAPSFIEESRKMGQDVFLAMFDIDSFKKINDIHGHEAGDAVLKDIGNKLEESFGTHGMVVRLGGEEFCAVLRDNGMDMAAVLDQFRIDVAESFMEYGELSLNYTLSIGLCAITDEKLDSMLRRADAALYRAKQNGRNRLEYDRES